jgi:signal transduction histidine kinase
MKLRAKTILILISVSLIPLIVLSLINYHNYKEVITAEVSSRLVAISDIQKKRLVSINEHNLERVNLITRNIELQENFKSLMKLPLTVSWKEMNSLLLKDLPRDTDFRAIHILDMRGVIIGSTDSISLGIDMGKSEQFREGKLKPDASVFFKDRKNRLSLYLTSPLYLEDKLSGVVCIELLATDIIEVVTDYTGLGQTGETVLGKKDSLGNILFLAPLRKDPDAALTRKLLFKENKPLFFAVQEKDTIVLNQSDYMGDPVLASTRSVKQTGWGIVTKIDRTEAFEYLFKLRNTMATMCLIAMIVIVLLAFYFSDTLTASISKLTAATERSIKGEPFREVITHNKDEIGILTDAFNDMNRKLDILNKAGKELTSSLDFKVILDNLSRIIVPGFADWFSIELFNDKNELELVSIMHSDSEKIQLAHDLRNEFPRDMNDKSGISKVLLTGKSEFYPFIDKKMLKQSAKNERHFQILNEIGFRSVMIIPLKSHEKIMGIISFVTSQESGRNFSESDLHLGEDLAGRIATTLDNAQLYKKAWELNYKKDEFMSIASHELKTPLTSVKAYLQLVEKTLETGSMGSSILYVHKAGNSIEKLNNLIVELLDVSRIESGKMQFNLQNFDFDEMLNEVIESIQNTAPNHKIIKSGGINRLIEGDKERLEQVVINLLTNAIKYSPDSNKILVKVETTNEKVMVTVSDYGIGIPKDKLDKVFDRFYRVETGGQRFQGLGIGLYISQEIIKRHKGKMWAESEEGKGSSFFFTIPVKS